MLPASPMICFAHGCRSGRLRMRMQNDEEREREEQVGDPHQEVVELAAVVAGQRADDGADERRRRTRPTKPTTSEMRPPQRTRLYRSRPMRRCRTSAALVGPWNAGPTPVDLVRVTGDLLGEDRGEAHEDEEDRRSPSPACAGGTAATRANRATERPERPLCFGVDDLVRATRPTAPRTAACSPTSGFD